MNIVKRLAAPGVAWLALCALLGGGSLLAWWMPAAWIDWQPELATAQPWRAWTSVFVHWSESHLLANVACAAVVASLGPTARLPWQATLAWLLAWPLTQLALLVQPALAHYGGLSGVLHAAVSVSMVWLLVRRQGRQRWIAAAVLLGMLVKLAQEEPWGPALHHDSDWDIATAPLAHATGALAGLLCVLLVLGLTRVGHRQSAA